MVQASTSPHAILVVVASQQHWQLLFPLPLMLVHDLEWGSMTSDVSFVCFWHLRGSHLATTRPHLVAVPLLSLALCYLCIHPSVLAAGAMVCREQDLPTNEGTDLGYYAGAVNRNSCEAACVASVRLIRRSTNVVPPSSAGPITHAMLRQSQVCPMFYPVI